MTSRLKLLDYVILYKLKTWKDFEPNSKSTQALEEILSECIKKANTIDLMKTGKEKNQVSNFSIQRIPFYASAALNYNKISLECETGTQKMDIVFSVHKGSKHIWNQDMTQIKLDVQVLKRFVPMTKEYQEFQKQNSE